MPATTANILTTLDAHDKAKKAESKQAKGGKKARKAAEAEEKPLAEETEAERKKMRGERTATRFLNVLQNGDYIIFKRCHGPDKMVDERTLL